MDRIVAIHKKLPNCHLVMHGSSSVPQDLQDELNKYGGKMKQTWGVPVEEIQKGIKHGVRKINVDTDCRIAITAAIRKVLADDARQVRPARLPEARPRSDEEGLRRPDGLLRPGRQRQQDAGGGAGVARQVRVERWRAGGVSPLRNACSIAIAVPVCNLQSIPTPIAKCKVAIAKCRLGLPARVVQLNSHLPFVSLMTLLPVWLHHCDKDSCDASG